jgi:peptide/nickel transport system permease protein
MTKYLLIRLAQFPAVLVGLSLIAFALMRVVPGDVATAILVGPDGSGRPSPEQISHLRNELGLNAPLWRQYLNWAGSAARGDLGRSLVDGTPVAEKISRAAPATLELACLAVILAVLIGVPLGALAAAFYARRVDQLFTVLPVMVLAVPTFWSAVLLTLLMVTVFRWLPPYGFTPITTDPLKNIQQVIWPALVIAAYFAAVLTRFSRSIFVDVFRQDYIRTARSKGLSKRLIVVRHTLKNAMAPIVTLIGVQFATIMGGTVIQENIWNLAGLGRLTVTGIDRRDYPVVQAMIVCFGIVVLCVNLAVDVCYAWLNPQIRYR